MYWKLEAMEFSERMVREHIYTLPLCSYSAYPLKLSSKKHSSNVNSKSKLKLWYKKLVLFSVRNVSD